MESKKEVKVSFWRIWRHFWLQARNYKVLFFGVFVGYGLGYIGASIVLPLYYKGVIDAIADSSSAEAAEPLMLAVLGIGITAVVYNIFFRASDFAITRFTNDVYRDLSNYAFRKINDHSYNFFINTFAGSLVTKTKRFIYAFERIYEQMVFNFFRYILIIGGILFVMYKSAPRVAIFFSVWIVFYIFISMLFVRKKIAYDEAEAESDSKVTGSLADALTNVLNIKMFAALPREKERFGDVIEESYQAIRRTWIFNNKMMVFQSLMMMSLEVGGMYLIARLWLAGFVSTGTVVLVQAYIATISGTIWNIGRSLAEFQKALTDASEFVEILDTTPDLLDPESPEECRIKDGHIELNSLSFAYGDGKQVFTDFNLDIPAGQKVGLVGRSGAGKSTVTMLMLRFADLSSGELLIDGQDISKITQNDLRECIAYIPQEPLLFHRSLRENIAYGNPDASEEEIVAAAKAAHAHEFILETKDGYDTLVGERGVKLSGGERQRVAIARAMLKQAPILILDEATSSLDAESEKLIQDAFENLMKGRTTIVIAHRLSTVQKMDRIIVLGSGEILEDGKHTELIKKDGMYANLWKHQTSGFIE